MSTSSDYTCSPKNEEYKQGSYPSSGFLRYATVLYADRKLVLIALMHIIACVVIYGKSGILLVT